VWQPAIVPTNPKKASMEYNRRMVNPFSCRDKMGPLGYC
jgi:hypothetical protein